MVHAEPKAGAGGPTGMLFDIRGRRRSVVKVVYGGLAVLFAVGFVGFGVGSDVGAGVFGSGHGGGGGGHGGGDGQSTDDQIEELHEQVADNPRSADAWRRLSLLEASVAFEQTGGHGGGTQPADDAAERLNLAVAAFEEYRDIVGRRRVEPAVAGGAARSYAALGLFYDAVGAQRLAIRERDPQGWFLLAQYAAAANDDELVDRAMSRAIRAAPRGQRETLRAQRVELRRQAFTVSPPAGGHGG